jgi:hypothetical protein
MKHQRMLFHARVGPVQFDTKCVRTRYTELVIFHLVGSAGHVVHSNVSDA